jgi:hypothetical protein
MTSLKNIGKPCAGKLHARFDEGGEGDTCSLLYPRGFSESEGYPMRRMLTVIICSYPANSTVLLRRTANGQPAMLMYEHGQGKVVVSSLYTDWGSAHGQATRDVVEVIL